MTMEIPLLESAAAAATHHGAAAAAMAIMNCRVCAHKEADIMVAPCGCFIHAVR